MIDDRVADRASSARDDVQVLGRQAALLRQQLGQRDRAERGLARRLQHDWAPGGDRRGKLVGDEVEREVERRDRADDTDRHSQREAQLAFTRRKRIERHHLPRQLARLCGRELERADRTLGLPTGRLDRLGRLLGDDHGELVAALGQQLRSLVENGGSLPQRERRLQCRLGNGDRLGDVLFGLSRDLADDRIVEGRANSDRVSHVDRRYLPYEQPSSSVPRLGRADFRLPIRGGASDAPENTMQAFEYAVDLGYRYLETDVQVTSDGVLVAFHDNDLQRTCGRPGKISELPWSEVSTGACRRKGPDPVAGGSARAPGPTVRVNIDCKSNAAVDALIASLRRTNSLPRVCVAAFSDLRMRKLRKALGAELCSALGPIELAMLRLGVLRKPPGLAAQVPVKEGPVTVVNRTFVERSHRLGLQVHVWTIDDRAEMSGSLDLGVDGSDDRPPRHPPRGPRIPRPVAHLAAEPALPAPPRSVLGVASPVAGPQLPNAGPSADEFRH